MIHNEDTVVSIVDLYDRPVSLKMFWVGVVWLKRWVYPLLKPIARRVESRLNYIAEIEASITDKSISWIRA